MYLASHSRSGIFDTLMP